MDRTDLLGDPVDIAPWLLNKVLVRGRRAGRIVEVEAYKGALDAAPYGGEAGERPQPRPGCRRLRCRHPP